MDRQRKKGADKMTEEKKNVKKIVAGLCFGLLLLALVMLYIFLTAENIGNLDDLIKTVSTLKDNVFDVITDVGVFKENVDDLVTFFSDISFVTCFMAFVSCFLLCFFLVTKNRGDLKDNVGDLMEDIGDSEDNACDLKEDNEIIKEVREDGTDAETEEEDYQKHKKSYPQNYITAHQRQLEKANYRQWTKAGLGLLYLKEGLAPFCQDIANQQHKDILHNIQRSKKLTGDMNCGTCHLKTLKPDHVKAGKKLCPLKQTNCNCCFPNGKIACQNHICGAVYDCIIQTHASTPPAPYWKNTDIQLWISDPWSIAKCFINAPGYYQKTSAAETDCTGLLHVIINNGYFHKHVTSNVSGTSIFSKVRGHRNLIFHSDSQELEETTANSYIDDMTAVLEDGKELANTSYAQEAVNKLKELKNKDFIITSENYETLLKQIREDFMNELNELKSNKEEEYEVLKRKLSNIETQISEQEKEIGIRPMVEDSPEQIELQYEKAKSELKQLLVKFYKNKRSTVPLSPLVEEKDTPLAGFYVMPNIVSVKQKSLTSDHEERSPVKSLRSIFITGREGQKEIYLSADAGFGKTSFSKYLAITWSQACCPDSNRTFFKYEDLKALNNFEFLFLVLLRDAISVCSVDEMIELQIMKKLPRLSSQYPLQDILEREKCLIILDGLDEWIHPDNGCSDQNEKVPHRYARDNCVILTTTRPWKLGVSNLKTSEVNKKIELVQLNDDSTYQLQKNAIRKMSGVNDDGVLRRKVRDFKEDINYRGLEHMQTIPLLLMYTTCLWCNKIPIGDSKVEVYINIIEFLLSRTVQKHPEVYPSSELSHSDIPIYFKKHQCCQKFYSFLTALAKLAIHAIFNEKREHTLVFDRSVAEKYLESDDMKLSLLSGILTGSTTTTLTERRSNVSFSHKTVQELFAAIFISFQSDAQETVAKKCKNVQSILDMTMVCEFVCQMSSNKMCELSAGFMSVLNEDEETHNYRTRTDVNWYNITLEPLYHIQKMLMSCLKKMPVTENLKLCLQDFFIDCGDIIDDKHLQRLSKLNNTNMKSLYINIFNTSNSLHDITETFSLTDLNNLQKLYYRGNRLEADISLLFFPSLQNVYLYRTTWTNYEGNLCNKLETLKNIQYLDIRLLTLSHEILEIILNFLSGNKTIKELTLERLSCKGYDYFDYEINFNLSKNSQLKKVRLERINLGENSLLLSRDMLNIEHVELERIKMSARSFRSIVKVLETIPQPVTVMMLRCNVEPNTEYEFVRNYIRSSQTFVVIGDQRCRFVFQRDMR